MAQDRVTRQYLIPHTAGLMTVRAGHPGVLIFRAKDEAENRTELLQAL
jgi:hypothetical protein